MIITASPGPSTNKNPHVDILLSSMPAGAATVTVWRTVDGVREQVRDLVQVEVFGSDEWPATDWEAPFGTDIVYDTIAWSSTGITLGSAQSAPTVLPVSVPWISDALAPGNARKVRFTAGSWAQLTYSRPGGPVTIAGARLPIAVTGVRNIGSGMPIGLYVPQVDVSAVREVLTSADPFLLRVPAVHGLPIPGAAYFTAADIVEQVLWVNHGSEPVADGSIFTFAADLVASQDLPIAVPPRTCRDLLDEANTCADLAALYETCTLLLRGP